MKKKKKLTFLIRLGFKHGYYLVKVVAKDDEEAKKKACMAFDKDRKLNKVRYWIYDNPLCVGN